MIAVAAISSRTTPIPARSPSAAAAASAAAGDFRRWEPDSRDADIAMPQTSGRARNVCRVCTRDMNFWLPSMTR